MAIKKRPASRSTPMVEAPDLSRRKARFQPKPRVLIYCEGMTEKAYLDNLTIDLGMHLVEIEVVGSVGDPRKVVEEAIKGRRAALADARRGRHGSFVSDIFAWAVFDRDEHLRIDEAFEIASKNDIKVAFSNPCFEVWGILHYEDHDAPDDRYAIQRKLASLMRNYHHEKNPYFEYEEIRDGRAAAIEFASAMRERRRQEDNKNGNPWTDVDILVSRLADLSGSFNEKLTRLEEIEAELAAINESITAGNTDASMFSRRSLLYSERKKLSST